MQPTAPMDLPPRRRLVTQVIGVTAGVAVITVLAAYGVYAGSSKGRETETVPTPTAAPPNTVAVLSCEQPTRLSGPLVITSGVDPSGARKRLVEDWNGAFPCARAELREIGPAPGKTWDAATERLRFAQLISRGETTIVNIDVAFLAEFAAPPRRGLGLLAEFPADTPVDGFLEAPLKSCSWEGRRYCLPFNSDVGMIAARLPAQNPGNWLTEPSPGVPPHPVSLQLGASNEAFVVNVLESLLSIDSDLLPPEVVPGQPVRVDLAAWNVAAEQLRRACHAGRIQVAGDEDQSVQAFNTNSVNYARIWPSGSTRLDGRVELYPLPVQGILGGQNLAVAAVADDVKKAWAFKLVSFLTSEASERLLFRDGGFAPTRSAAYDVSRAGPLKDPTALLHAIMKARTRPGVPAYFEVSDIIVKYLKPVLDSTTQKPIPPAFAVELRAALEK